ncbi:G protein-coupled glucose receptor regulating Gpa2-domain-containing protein [Boeremia exigua]|uniref:G protein-coupled glucose receptor regulating Gpa2-domain-containing protein n=1 Tax=Boeremia exigua TaxID=749465 RepID=UPI001E8E129B|nr:G protein-coupled glucose receptor regulating Gpa2-domain-containing protein [Boeremia exigua]KAH6638397.1 G protein-coupled glucose receptor regulating Gpa2-domain-containing protein [Boeremia exigua]
MATVASTTEALAAWDPASSIPTLIGSILSVTSTALVILLWIFAGGKRRRDFRYALILNLTVAEFINSLNNSVSGAAAVARRRPLLPGLACEINGWTGQFSVQAVDFSILAITLITLLTIQLRSFIIYASALTKALICLSIWIIPLCTSIYAWTKNYYGPVSGNWCWIEARYFRQRYALNHGWRFAIFAISLCTYIYVFLYMSRRLRPQNLSNLSSSIPDSLDYEKINEKPRDGAVLAGCGATPRISLDQTSENPTAEQSKKHRRAVSSFSFARKLTIDTTTQGTHDQLRTNSPSDDNITSPDETFVLVDLEKGPASKTAEPIFTSSPINRVMTKVEKSKIKIDREIWKMLLLNMYPVTYLILWIPGIANRIAESMGHSVRLLVILQSSTQYIGFANAAVYLYKEHERDIREWWGGVQGRKAAKAATAKVASSDASSGRITNWRSVSS